MQYSIVNYSEVEKVKRFDAEYFKPEYFKKELLIKKKSYDELRNLISLLTDYHANGSYETLKSNVQLKSASDYAHMIRTVDIEKDDFENDIISISKHAYNFLSKTKVYGGEIIINKIGNAGKVYLIPPVDRKTSLGMNQFMIRTNNRVNNYYLYCYLAGKYGQNQLSQRITGAVPLSIDKESTRSVLVPVFLSKFEELVSKKVSSYFQFLKKSKNIYKEAQDLLLSELGLTDWQPRHQLAFIKNYSDTQETERIDAEYYQPKYEAIVHAIKKYSGGWDTLGNLVQIRKCIEVGSNEYLEEGMPFVRVSNISPFEITEEKYISKTLYNELTPQENNIPFEKSQNHQPKQGEILFSKDGSPGIAHYLKEPPRKMIPSGGILRLKTKTDKIKNEYLTLVLNSVLIQEQVKRDVGGSIILHWRPGQVKQTVVPILPENKQTQIQKKVIESFTLRKQSKHLLECAKKAVEMAIEQDEQIALNWLENETEKYKYN